MIIYWPNYLPCNDKACMYFTAFSVTGQRPNPQNIVYAATITVLKHRHPLKETPWKKRKIYLLCGNKETMPNSSRIFFFPVICLVKCCGSKKPKCVCMISANLTQSDQTDTLTLKTLTPLDKLIQTPPSLLFFFTFNY